MISRNQKIGMKSRIFFKSIFMTVDSKERRYLPTHEIKLLELVSRERGI